MVEKNSVLEQQTEMNRLYCESNELYHSLAMNFGLSDSVMWILYTLNERSCPCTPKEIGEVCSLSKQTVHSALQSLEREGCIEITVSTENRKNKLAGLTETGRGLVEDTIAKIVEAELRAFSDMDKGERAELLRLLGKYQKLLKAESDRLILK